MADGYTGAVCYQDGWHYTVVQDAAGHDQPGDRLFLDDDGSYRLAVDGDASWHDRKHRGYAMLIPEDGGKGVAVSSDELKAVEELLRERRGG